MKAIAFILAGVAICFAAPAIASCSSEVTPAISAGMHFLRDGQAYERRDEKELADADYENMGHQLELISDDMKSCTNPKLSLEYYLLSSYDLWHRYFHLAGTTDDLHLKQGMAKALRTMVSLFYLSGGYNAYPKDYIDLKGSVEAAYGDAKLKYCSPESESCCAPQ
jgi:hypothetical protein